VDVVTLVAIMALLGAVAWLVVAPLRAGSAARDEERYEGARADLEAAKEAKYAEIRDAELDHATGKLSDADWHAVDRQLRAEAIEILQRLDELGVP
jgi:hypothetical protein